ncbi:MAG: type II secretion system F family protein [Bacillota bacterium]
MTEFAYRVRDKQGRPSTGSIQASTEKEAVQQLRTMGYTVTALTAKRMGASESLSRLKGTKLGGVRLKDLAVLTRQLSAVLSAGLTLAVALDSLSKQTGNMALKQVLEDVRLGVSRGSSFSEALSKHPRVFSALYINSVLSGEAGGSLDSVLDQLAKSLESDLELTNKVRSALYYPATVIVVAIILVVVMSIFILPTFVDMFVSSGMELPFLTRILVKGVQGFRVWGPLIFAVLLLMGVLARLILKDPRARRYLDRLFLRLPLLGILIRQVLVARMSRTLAMLLSAGVPLMSSLRITAEVVRNSRCQEALAEVAEAVQRGEGLGPALSRHDVFPALLGQMVTIGEETGAVEDMLNRLGDMYEIEVEATVRGMTSLIEPAIIIVLGVGIGFIVAAIFLPLVNMINTL